MSSNAELLRAIEGGKGAQVYLITGEEFLVRKTSDELVAKLMPPDLAALNLSILEGVSPAAVARDLSTYPLLRGAKVVVVREPEFLAPKKGRGDALSKIKDAWLGGRKKIAASRMLALLAKANLGVPELVTPDPDTYSEQLEIELAEADLAFLRDMGAFCQAEGITAPEGDSGALEALLEKGLPKGHTLVIEATAVDGRSKLVKLLEKVGVRVEREVVREIRKLDIGEVAAELLAPFKKRLDKSAEALLKDLCGGNMRLLQGELEKLAIYVGAEKATIGEEEVRLLVRHAREEEFGELADALQKRDVRGAIDYLETALGQGEAPLRLHGSIATIVRQLLEARERWAAAGLSARTAKGEFDARGLPFLAEEMKAKGAKVPHPWVAWLGFQACMRFELRELIRAHLAVARADVALKTGGQPRLVLESLVLAICAKA